VASAPYLPTRSTFRSRKCCSDAVGLRSVKLRPPQACASAIRSRSGLLHHAKQRMKLRQRDSGNGSHGLQILKSSSFTWGCTKVTVVGVAGRHLDDDWLLGRIERPTLGICHVQTLPSISNACRRYPAYTAAGYQGPVPSTCIEALFLHGRSLSSRLIRCRF
jgi:hypothetical protein